MVGRHLLEAAGLRVGEGHGGAVTLIQRFGSAVNFNIHVHCLGQDGAHRFDADGAPIVVEAAVPTDVELPVLLQAAVIRLIKILTRRCVLVEDMGRTYLAEPEGDGEEARRRRPLQAAAITCRIAFGPHAGQKVPPLRGRCRTRKRRAGRCEPTSAGSACTPRCGSKLMTARGWSNCAAVSRGRLC